MVPVYGWVLTVSLPVMLRLVMSPSVMPKTYVPIFVVTVIWLPLMLYVASGELRLVSAMDGMYMLIVCRRSGALLLLLNFAAAL